MLLLPGRNHQKRIKIKRAKVMVTPDSASTRRSNLAAALSLYVATTVFVLLEVGMGSGSSSYSHAFHDFDFHGVLQDTVILYEVLQTARNTRISFEELSYRRIRELQFVVSADGEL